MAVLANLARMTTATTGTGTITLVAAATGFLSFAAAGITNGQSVSYAIEDGSNREVGRGTYTTSGTTLTRSVLVSTNSNSPISLSGTAQVFVTALAEDFGGLVKIGSTQTPTSVAALDFTGLSSTYNLYVIELQSIRPATDGANLQGRTSTNAGVSFDSGASDYNSSGGTSSFGTVANSVGNAAGEGGFSGTIRIARPSTTTLFCTVMVDGLLVDTNGDLQRINTGFMRATAADVDSFRLYFSTGNIASGFATLYGVTP